MYERFFANCLILLNGASTVVAVELQRPFNVVATQPAARWPWDL
jgi:hypothetical protein